MTLWGSGEMTASAPWDPSRRQLYSWCACPCSSDVAVGCSLHDLEPAFIDKHPKAIHNGRPRLREGETVKQAHVSTGDEEKKARTVVKAINLRRHPVDHGFPWTEARCPRPINFHLEEETDASQLAPNIRDGLNLRSENLASSEATGGNRRQYGAFES